MDRQCGSCVCSAAPRQACDGRLVLATAVDHTATSLRSLALRQGRRLRPLAPGLLELRGGELDEFLAAARVELSSVEADEVRCLVVDGAVPDSALLGRAMGASSLTTAGARVAHADLLPLFDDEHGSFHAVYQPIVELAGEAVVGHEALLRATAPGGTPVFPDVLFPAAEAAGWTHVLDRIGRTTALHHAGPWLGDAQLFINFVPTSIYRPEICLRTTEIAAEQAGLRLDQLVFEVTEGHQVRDLDHLARVFDYYRERGCKVAIDDLGAGYSSLNMLVRLQPDVVKLDKDIVQALPDPVSSAVVAAVVAITHAYGGTVLAECVETPEQARAARELGVDLGQGWLFGRPVRPQEPQDVRPAAVPQVPSRPDTAVALSGGGASSAPSAPGAPGASLGAVLERASRASSSGLVVVDVLDPQQPVVHVNAAFERISGYSAADLVGRNARVLQAPETDREVVAQVRAAVRDGAEHTAVLRNLRRDGTLWWNELHLSPVRDADGRLTHYLGFQSDVTARVEAEQQLLHLSRHDPLTGLLNRPTLLEQLDLAVEQGGTAVLLVDLAGFRAVNDRHGQRAGDQVLAEAASRLRSALRADDLLARLGADEFLAVLSGLDALDGERVVARVAADLLGVLDRPFPVGDSVVVLTACIGTAVQAGAATTSADLLAAAGTAEREARATGPGSVSAAGRTALVPSPRTARVSG